MVVGARLLGFLRSTFSSLHQEWSTTQRTSSQQALESTWTSIHVSCLRHLEESMLKQIEAVLRETQIRKVFKNNVILSVYFRGYLLQKICIYNLYKLYYNYIILGLQ